MGTGVPPCAGLISRSGRAIRARVLEARLGEDVTLPPHAGATPISKTSSTTNTVPKLEQTLKTLPLVSASRSKAEVVSEVERQSGTAAFERRASSGGALGLRLNEEGALTQVVSHP